MTTDTCTRALEDGSLCGGMLSPWMRGRHTGRYLRTCRRCYTTINTETAPPGYELPGPTVHRFAGELPQTWQERLEEGER